MKNKLGQEISQIVFAGGICKCIDMTHKILYTISYKPSRYYEAEKITLEQAKKYIAESTRVLSGYIVTPQDSMKRFEPQFTLRADH